MRVLSTNNALHIQTCFEVLFVPTMNDNHELSAQQHPYVTVAVSAQQHPYVTVAVSAQQHPYTMYNRGCITA